MTMLLTNKNCCFFKHKGERTPRRMRIIGRRRSITIRAGSMSRRGCGDMGIDSRRYEQLASGLRGVVRGSGLCGRSSLGVTSLTTTVSASTRALSCLFGRCLRHGCCSCVGSCHVTRFGHLIGARRCSGCALDTLTRLYNFDSHTSFFHCFGGTAKVAPGRCVQDVKKGGRSLSS